MKNTGRCTSPYSHSLLLSYWNWDCTSSEWFIVRFSYHVCNSRVDVYYVRNDGFEFFIEQPGEKKGSWRRSWKPGSCSSLVFCCASVALFLTYIASCINKLKWLFVDCKKTPRRWIEHLTLWSSVIRSPNWAILASIGSFLFSIWRYWIREPFGIHTLFENHASHSPTRSFCCQVHQPYV